MKAAILLATALAGCVTLPPETPEEVARRQAAAAAYRAASQQYPIRATLPTVSGGAGLTAPAALTGARLGSSVTGQPVWVCTYSVGGTTFDRAIPYAAGSCPATVAVQ